MTTSHQLNTKPVPNSAVMIKSRTMQKAHRRRSKLASVFDAFCAICGMRFLRSRAIRFICRLEGGQMWSETFRKLLRHHYKVEVGLHSYGTCLWPGGLPEGTKVGNYCSLANGLVALRRNHTMDRVSQHPFFYNSALGLVDPGLIHDLSDNPLTIGHDVWIGYNTLIMPSCRSIGNSAVIAAGSVVTTDVPAFAIYGGVPAKLIRWRFPEPLRNELDKSEWWLRPIWELSDDFDLFTRAASPEIAQALINSLKR